MPLPDFAPLPEMGVAHDRVAAVIEVDAHILFLRRMAHTGTFLCLPGGWRDGVESFESACLRTATREIMDAVRELSRQVHVEPHVDRVALQIRGKLGDHPFGRLGRTHYFEAVGSGHSIFSEPSVAQEITPNPRIWRPYRWVSVSELESQKIEPLEAVAICLKKRQKGGEPGATDNPDDAQRLREDH